MLLAVLLLLQAQSVSTFSTPVNLQKQRSTIEVRRPANKKAFDFKRAETVLFVGEDRKSDEDASAPGSSSKSFDDAGRSLVDEEDQKRMEEMGDFDDNPSVSPRGCRRLALL